MALPNSTPIDLDLIYSEALANGFTGQNNLADLISWSGWTNLPPGANSILDFLGTNTTEFTINPLGTAFEFDPIKGHHNSAVVIDSSHVVNFWSGEQDDGFCRLFEVDASGNVIPVGALIEFDTIISEWHDSALLDSTHIIHFWEGPGSDGYCQVFRVNTSQNTLVSLGTAYEFDTQHGINHNVVAIDSQHVINFWTNSNVGFCQVFQIDLTTGVITPKGSPFQYDSNAGWGSALKIDGNRVINFWGNSSGGSANGFTQIFDISTSSGSITPMGTPLEIGSPWFIYMSPVLIDSNHVICFWTGSGWFLRSSIFEIDASTGNILMPGDQYYPYINEDGWAHSAVLISPNHAVDFWWDNDTFKSYYQVFKFNASNGSISTHGPRTQFSAQGSWNSAHLLQSNRIINFWDGGAKGLCQVFEIVPTS